MQIIKFGHNFNYISINDSNMCAQPTLSNIFVIPICWFERFAVTDRGSYFIHVPKCGIHALVQGHRVQLFSHHIICGQISCHMGVIPWCLIETQFVWLNTQRGHNSSTIIYSTYWLYASTKLMLIDATFKAFFISIYHWHIGSVQHYRKLIYLHLDNHLLFHDTLISNIE
jgi:hypothetical protein